MPAPPSAAPRERTLIVTADDFGASLAVNEAVEAAHRDGILTAASLMVAAPAAADAVTRAKRLPSLKVGLHLVLTDGAPLLPPHEIPALVGRDGRFIEPQAWAGVRYFFDPAARRQLASEIEAQFAAFAATGLALDHANAHKHMHLHPTVARLMIGIGRRYGLKALRLPYEPAAPLAGAGEWSASGMAAGALRAWSARLRHRIGHAGLITSDQLFGLAWSGCFTEQRLLALLPLLPQGVSEIYAHPATGGGWPGAVDSYRYREEFDALASPRVRAALAALDIRLTSFGALGAGRAA
jgi:hopanoid biosynthesis associated protein HpnK